MNRWGMVTCRAAVPRGRYPARCVSSAVPPALTPSSSDDPEFTESSKGKEALTQLVRKTIRMGSDVHQLNQSVRLLDDANAAMRVHLAKLAPRMDALESQHAELLSRQQSLAALLSQVELKLSQLESRRESQAARAEPSNATLETDVASAADTGLGKSRSAPAQTDVPRPGPTQSPWTPAERERMRNEYQWLRNRVESLAATVSLLQHERSVEKVAPIAPRRRGDRGDEQAPSATAATASTGPHNRGRRLLPMSAVEDVSGDVVVRAAKVLVRHIPPSIPATTIRTLCASVGPVKSVMLVQNFEKSDANHRTMVVTFDSVASANEAVRKLNGKLLGVQQRASAVEGQRRFSTASSTGGPAASDEEQGIVVEPYAVYDVAAEATSELIVAKFREERGDDNGEAASDAPTASPLPIQKLKLTPDPGDERPGGTSRDKFPRRPNSRDDAGGDFRLEDMLDAFDHHNTFSDTRV